MFRHKESKKKKINKYINNSLGKCLVYDAIFIFILVFSMAFKDRVFTFSDIFGSLFGLENVGLYIFYGCLIIGVVFYTVLIIRTIAVKNDSHLYKYLDKVEKYGDIPIFIVRCITGILFVMIYITTPCTVDGISMNPTFENGDKVMTFNLGKSYKSGDVIVFSHDFNEETFLIKRVCASEGDKISYFKTGIYSNLYVNDELVESISSTEYSKITLSIGLNSDTKEFIVPKDKILVLGDNRGNSVDSRSFGLIDEDDVFGKVYLRIFPFNKFGGF